LFRVLFPLRLWPGHLITILPLALYIWVFQSCLILGPICCHWLWVLALVAGCGCCLWVLDVPHILRSRPQRHPDVTPAATDRGHPSGHILQPLRSHPTALPVDTSRGHTPPPHAVGGYEDVTTALAPACDQWSVTAAFL